MKSKINKLNIETKTKSLFYGFIPNDRKRNIYIQQHKNGFEENVNIKKIEESQINGKSEINIRQLYCNHNKGQMSRNISIQKSPDIKTEI